MERYNHYGFDLLASVLKLPLYTLKGTWHHSPALANADLRSVSLPKKHFTIK